MSSDKTDKGRFVLGMLQMFGAVASMTVLVRTGFNSISLTLVIGTSLLTTVSVLLYGSRAKEGARLQKQPLAKR